MQQCSLRSETSLYNLNGAFGKPAAGLGSNKGVPPLPPTQSEVVLFGAKTNQDTNYKMQKIEAAMNVKRQGNDCPKYRCVRASRNIFYILSETAEIKDESSIGVAFYGFDIVEFFP